jgi:L-ascorbate metabolism protein UlaG (beta-lactamase superfamily)
MEKIMPVEITWLGHSCFRLRDRAATVVTDPYGKDLGLNLVRVRADIVTVSHDADDHNYVKGVKGDFQVLTGPGEYEVSSVFVTGLELRGDRKAKKESMAAPRYGLPVRVRRFDRVPPRDLNLVPTQAQVEEALGEVDVLLIPVGGGETLTASQAAEVVSLLEPHVVVPMHYHVPDSTLKLDSVNKFLKEMGLDRVAPQEVLKVSRASLLEETQVVLLEMKTKEEAA